MFCWNLPVISTETFVEYFEQVMLAILYILLFQQKCYDMVIRQEIKQSYGFDGSFF